MTIDLSVCIQGKDMNESHYLTTEQFLEALDQGLQSALNNQ